MAKRKPVTVGGEVFPTKKALQERVKKILWSYKDGDTVDMFDTPFLLALFTQHPDAEQKFGAGVAHIEVRRNPVYRQTQGFWLVREDGTETDISYLECLTPTPHHKRFERACRVALEPVMMAFKQKFFDDLQGEPYHCPFTGEALSFVGSHVDHVPPQTFKSILADFIKEYGIDVDSVSINGRGDDGVIQDTLDDLALEEKWIDYHNRVAELRILSRLGNLSHAKQDN